MQSRNPPEPHDSMDEPREAQRALDGCLQYAAGRFHGACMAELRRRLQQAEARSARLLDMAQDANSTLELDEVIRRVAKHIAAAAGVPHCGLLLIDMQQGTFTPRFELTAALRDHAARLGRMVLFSPLPQPIAGSALTRQIIERREPVVYADVQVDPFFQQDDVRAWGFKSLLALPLAVKERAVAAAWAFTLDRHCTFSKEQIDLCRGLAEIAAPAIENARLYREAKTLAICEERARLAQEMHDELAQTLNGINWRAASVDRLLTEGQTEQAQAALRELKAAAKQGYADVRQRIFGLRSSATVAPQLRAALEQYLNGRRSHDRLDVELVADQEPLPPVAGEVQLQAMRIVQEALANVARHAGTGQARVCLGRDNGRLRIRVEDEGCGFDPAIGARGPDHFGLSIMRERARSVGGELTVDSQPGAGTRVTLWLPLIESRGGGAG